MLRDLFQKFLELTKQVQDKKHISTEINDNILIAILPEIPNEENTRCLVPQFLIALEPNISGRGKSKCLTLKSQICTFWNVHGVFTVTWLLGNNHTFYKYEIKQLRQVCYLKDSSALHVFKQDGSQRWRKRCIITFSVPQLKVILWIIYKLKHLTDGLIHKLFKNAVSIAKHTQNQMSQKERMCLWSVSRHSHVH